jgi:hypothetical protein
MQSIPNKIFFEEIGNQLSIGKTVCIKAQGNSMYPFIKNETDELLLQKLNESILKGMIVLAQLNNGNYVIHRVKRVLQHTVILKGDGSVRETETCAKNNVTAKVIAVIRNGKQIRENSIRWIYFRYAWLSNRFARKILLALYRRLDRLFPASEKIIYIKPKSIEMQLKKNLNIRKVGNEYLLTAEGDLGIDYTFVISLNNSAFYLVNEVREKTFSKEDWIQLLMDKYEVSREAANDDVEQLIGTLTNGGIIV